MRLIHLPTLDGSPEAAVERLEAIARLQATSEVEDGLWHAQNVVNDLVDKAEDYDGASSLRAEHEAILTNVQHEIDRLVAS